MMPNIGLGKIPYNIIYNCIGYFNSYSSPWMKKKKKIFFKCWFAWLLIPGSISWAFLYETEKYYDSCACEV